MSTASRRTAPIRRPSSNPCRPDLLRREAATSLPTLFDDLATWIDINTLAWGQRYAVVAACRILYTLQTAAVATKLGALHTLHQRWQRLLGQVRDDRGLGWVPGSRPRPGEADAAREFVRHVVALADRAEFVRD